MIGSSSCMRFALWLLALEGDRGSRSALEDHGRAGRTKQKFSFPQLFFFFFFNIVSIVYCFNDSTGLCQDFIPQDAELTA